MSNIKQTRISLRKGLKSDLPSHAPLGEPLYCVDTKELYVGMGFDKEVVDLLEKPLLHDIAKILRYPNVSDDETTIRKNYGGDITLEPIVYSNKKVELSGIALNYIRCKTMEFNSCEVHLSNLNLVDVDIIRFNKCKKVTIDNCTFKDVERCPVYATDCGEIHIKSCTGSNIGKNLSYSDSQYLGGFIYGSNTQLVKITKCEFDHIYGQGAIRLTDCNRLEVKGCISEDTAYRFISIFNTKIITTGYIDSCNVLRCGSINETNSGVGCNGIFVGGIGSSIDVTNCYICDVCENAIEGSFNIVANNVIKNTGINTLEKPTPSTEGIFVVRGEVTNNTIINPNLCGIYVYSDSGISNIKITNNRIIHDTPSMNPAIRLVAKKLINGCSISGNISSNFESCISLEDNKGLSDNLNNVYGNMELTNLVSIRGNLNNVNILDPKNTVLKNLLTKANNISPLQVKNGEISDTDNGCKITSTNIYGGMLYMDIPEEDTRTILTGYFIAQSSLGLEVKIVPYDSTGRLDYSNCYTISKKSLDECKLRFCYALTKNTKYQIQFTDKKLQSGAILNIKSIVIEKLCQV